MCYWIFLSEHFVCDHKQWTSLRRNTCSAGNGNMWQQSLRLIPYECCLSYFNVVVFLSCCVNCKEFHLGTNITKYSVLKFAYVQQSVTKSADVLLSLSLLIFWRRSLRDVGVHHRRQLQRWPAVSRLVHTQLTPQGRETHRVPTAARVPVQQALHMGQLALVSLEKRVWRAVLQNDTGQKPPTCSPRKS